MSEENTKKWMSQALARGYCTDRNKHKILDPDLIEDMVEEVYNEGVRQFARVVDPPKEDT